MGGDEIHCSLGAQVNKHDTSRRLLQRRSTGRVVGVRVCIARETLTAIMCARNWVRRPTTVLGHGLLAGLHCPCLHSRLRYSSPLPTGGQHVIRTSSLVPVTAPRQASAYPPAPGVAAKPMRLAQACRRRGSTAKRRQHRHSPASSAPPGLHHAHQLAMATQTRRAWRRALAGPRPHPSPFLIPSTL